LKIKKSEEAKNNELLSIERKAKLYSYVEVDDSKIINIDITTNNNIKEIVKVSDIFSLLKYTENIDIEKESALTMHLPLRYLTNILPNEVFVDHVEILFHKLNKVCKRIELKNYNKDFKFLYVNSKSSCLSLHGIITNDQASHINNTDLYDTLSVYIGVSFKNVFKMVTTGVYFLQLEPSTPYLNIKSDYTNYFYKTNYNCFNFIDIKEDV